MTKLFYELLDSSPSGWTRKIGRERSLKKCDNAQVTYIMFIISCSLSFQRKLLKPAVRYCEQLKRREQEEDNVTIEELEKQRVEALEVVEKEREIVEQERAVYDSIADKISKS